MTVKFKPGLRLATRKSPLAMWQALHVHERLTAAWPALEVEIVQMTTQGDKILDTPLAKVGGKGLFLKELEQALLDQSADIAVHSMKDVPVELPPGLHIPVIMTREDSRDAFVSTHFPDLSSLPAGARVGTSSLRRQCQLRARYPDIEVVDVRGNVNTRLSKLDNGDFDALILAAAGLKRLGLEARITTPLSVEESLPAIGQGAIGIECRSGDEQVMELISVLDDKTTHICLSAERAMNKRLQGGCQAPVAGHAVLESNNLLMSALVGMPDGSQLIRGERSGAASDAEAIGLGLAEYLLEQGAGPILETLLASAS